MPERRLGTVHRGFFPPLLRQATRTWGCLLIERTAGSRPLPTLVETPLPDVWWFQWRNTVTLLPHKGQHRSLAKLLAPALQFAGSLPSCAGVVVPLGLPPEGLLLTADHLPDLDPQTSPLPVIVSLPLHVLRAASFLDALRARGFQIALDVRPAPLPLLESALHRVSPALKPPFLRWDQWRLSPAVERTSVCAPDGVIPRDLLFQLLQVLPDTPCLLTRPNPVQAVTDAALVRQWDRQQGLRLL